MEVKINDLLSQVASIFEFFSYDREETVERFLAIAKTLKDYDGYALVTQNEDHPLSVMGMGVTSPDPALLEEMRLEDFLCQEEGLNTNPPFTVDLVDEKTETPLFPKNGPLRSYACVPLITRSNLIGLLFLASLKEGFFKEEEMDPFFTLGSQMAVALENIRLYDQSQERIDVLSSLYKSETSISSAIDTEELLDRINQEALRLLRCTCSTIFLKEEKTQTLLISGKRRTSSGARRGRIDAKEITPEVYRQLFEEKVAYEWHSGNDEAPEPVFLSNRAIQSILAIPLLLKKDRVMALLVLESNRRTSFGNTQRGLVNVFVPHVSAALQNSLLYNELQGKVEELERSSSLIQEYTNTLRSTNESLERRVYELQTLYDVGTAVNTSVDLDRILNFIMTKALTVMSCEKGSIMMLDESHKVLKYRVVRGVNPESAKSSFKIGEGIAGWVAKFGIPRIVESIHKDTRYVHLRKGPVRDDTLLCVPLKVEDRVIGVLNVDRPAEVGPFTADDQALLMALANQAGAAIEKAQVFEEMEELFNNTLEAFANAIDTKDAYTHGHSKRVREIAVAIATTLNLSEEEIQTIGWAALLHDIGKIFIPNEILNKTKKLSPEEFHIMSKHPVYGSQILQPIKRMKKVTKLVYHHHENYDGTGYPEGRRGDEIPHGAAIIAVADAFDTMVSDRPYRVAPGIQYAVQEFKRCSGTQFDPLVVGAFLSIINSLLTTRNLFPKSLSKEENGIIRPALSIVSSK